MKNRNTNALPYLHSGIVCVREENGENGFGAVNEMEMLNRNENVEQKPKENRENRIKRDMYLYIDVHCTHTKKCRGSSSEYSPRCRRYRRCYSMAVMPLSGAYIKTEHACRNAHSGRFVHEQYHHRHQQQQQPPPRQLRSI